MYPINVLDLFCATWPLLTNPFTLLQARSVTHSLFLPTYLSPLHPSSASSPSHPTYPLHLSPSTASVRSLLSREGARGPFKGLLPGLSSVLLKTSIVGYDGGWHDGDEEEAEEDADPSPPSLLPRAASSREGMAWDVELFLPWLNARLIPVAVLVTYPLDLARTLLQLQQHSYVALPSPTAPGDWHLLSQRPSMSGVLLRTVRAGGWRALWRGGGPSVVGQSALLYAALRVVDEASAVTEDHSAADPSEAGSPPPFSGDGQDPAITWPMSLVDRLTWLTYPYSAASLGLLLSSYLLLHYPLSTLSLHMRAAGFEAAHVSAVPLTAPPHPPGLLHLQVQRGVERCGVFMGMGDVARRVVERDGWAGLWRGLRWSAWKLAMMGLLVGAVSALTTDEEDDGDD